MTNQFNQTDKERLYNTATGKAAPANTEVLMLEEKIKKISSFSECIKRPERLQERIAKQKMPTFETELRREKKNRKCSGKVDSACFVCVTYLGVFCVFLMKKKLI